MRNEEFRRKEEARKAKDAEEQRERDRDWDRRKTAGPACKQQCASTLSACQARCAGNSMCRGNCQTSEWKCKEGCR